MLHDKNTRITGEVTAYNVNINQKLVLIAFLLITSFLKGSTTIIVVKIVTYMVVDVLYHELYYENK